MESLFFSLIICRTVLQFTRNIKKNKNKEKIKIHLQFYKNNKINKLRSNDEFGNHTTWFDFHKISFHENVDGPKIVYRSNRNENYFK